MTIAAHMASDVLGTPVSRLTMSGAIALVDDAIRSRSRLMIGVVNAAKIVNMRTDAALRESVLSSDIILADGFSIVAAAKLLGDPVPERVAGIDLMEKILARGDELSYRVFCLGATEEVLASVREHIAAIYPGVEVCGSQHGYFDEQDERAVAQMIKDSRADVLFVAMTSPKKERFLLNWGAAIDVPVCHGVGGSFDVIAGKVQRAPDSWQRLGLEWLYRVKQEPRRLWKRYLVTNSIFVSLVLAELCRQVSHRVSGSPRLRGSA